MNKNELFKEYLEICLKVESQQFASMVSTWGGVGTAGWSFSPQEHECKKSPKMPQILRPKSNKITGQPKVTPRGTRTTLQAFI